MATSINVQRLLPLRDDVDGCDDDADSALEEADVKIEFFLCGGSGADSVSGFRLLEWEEV